MGWAWFLIILGASILLAQFYWWIWIIVVFLILFGLGYLFSGDKNKKCAWCDGVKIKFKDGVNGSWSWINENKDGSRDKRFKDNYQVANYTSNFLCEECGATTKFVHYLDKAPSADVKVRTRKLSKKGIGERKGTNWPK